MSGAALERYAHRLVPATESARPTLVLLHGTGGDENDLVPLGRLLAPGAALLAPRGNVLENGMPRFFRRFAEGVFDLEDLARRTGELAEFLAAARAAHGLEGPLLAAGFSNGANIAASLLLTRPETLAGAMLFRSMLPFVPERTPSLAGKPIFLSAGRADAMVGLEAPEKLAALFRKAGADVTLAWDAEGHTLGFEAVRAAKEWLVRTRLVEMPRPRA